jgi:hypothetical protein
MKYRGLLSLTRRGPSVRAAGVIRNRRSTIWLGIDHRLRTLRVQQAGCGASGEVRFAGCGIESDKTIGERNCIP